MALLLFMLVLVMLLCTQYSCFLSLYFCFSSDSAPAAIVPIIIRIGGAELVSDKLEIENQAV